MSNVTLNIILFRNEREEVPDEWQHKALYLELPYDNVRRLHLQYEGFEEGMTLYTIVIYNRL